MVGAIVDTLAMAKEMYPGKRNSLDSLCDRLDVDNSGRTLHGALLDAELLADVYINMTRGQEALLMDTDAATDEVGAVANVDLRDFDLPVLRASDAELRSPCADSQGTGQGQWWKNSVAGARGGLTLWHNLRLFRQRQQGG